MTPLRVLQVVSNMNSGGIENMLMNLYREIDRTKVQFDFLLHTQEKCVFEDEILELGGRILRISPLRLHSIKNYLEEVDQIFRNNNYLIVHSHISVWSYFVLRVAKKNNISVRIAHSHESHESVWDHKMQRVPFILLLKSLINKPLTHRFACGNAAGKWLFGNKKFTVLNNAINVDRFLYNKEIQLQIKKELHLENDLVFGHVGRFNKVKNHIFLVEIFEKLRVKITNARLVLVGDGDLKEEIQLAVMNKGLQNEVVFLGERNDVPNLLQAFDFFLMPSLSEGLPVSLIEAQANGLKIFGSDQISREADITNNISFLPISEGIDIWVNEILENLNYQKQNTKDLIIAANYDIESNTKKMESFYLESSRQR